MKKQLILLALLFCYFCCASQKKEIISKSTIKLEGRNTNIRDLLDIDGYYDVEAPIGRYCTVFFEDGTYSLFRFKEDATKEKIRKNMSGWVDNWIKHGQIRWGSSSCVYRIEGDTIIGHYYDRSGLWNSEWSFYEERYKIINKTTIKRIYRTSLQKADESYYQSLKGYSPWISNALPLYFFPADSIPPSDCWLKEEKWIWRNELDWKAYMEKIKQKKKKKK